jgi:hypothetical protein
MAGRSGKFVASRWVEIVFLFGLRSIERHARLKYRHVCCRFACASGLAPLEKT